MNLAISLALWGKPGSHEGGEGPDWIRALTIGRMVTEVNAKNLRSWLSCLEEEKRQGLFSLLRTDLGQVPQVIADSQTAWLVLLERVGCAQVLARTNAVPFFAVGWLLCATLTSRLPGVPDGSVAFPLRHLNPHSQTCHAPNGTVLRRKMSILADCIYVKSMVPLWVPQI